jgi:hypothetical protein
MPVIPVVGR